MLKFYVKMGVKVTQFHRVIKFKQDYICRDYIQNNINKRATAKTDVEKDVRKLNEQLTIWKTVHESSKLPSNFTR